MGKMKTVGGDTKRALGFLSICSTLVHTTATATGVAPRGQSGAAALEGKGLDMPYPSSGAVTSALLPVAEAGRSPAEILFLESLGGNLARTTPTLYRVATADWQQANTSDPASLWLQDLQAAHGVSTNSSMLTAPTSAFLQAFRASLHGYVRCLSADESTSAALTFAAAGEGVVIAADADTESMLVAAQVPLLQDLRGKRVADVIASPAALRNLSSRVFMFQDASKASCLGEYGVFARAATLPYGSDKASQATLLNRAQQGMGACFGWGPENDYVSACNSHGLFVHASDYNKNLAALSNAPSPAASSAPPSERLNSWDGADGDNLQWTLGPWAVSQTWYGSSSRGRVPLGWTYSPATAWVAPSALRWVHRHLTPNDELVAGPSGVGYVYPSTWPGNLQGEFADATAQGMQQAGMRLVNVLCENDTVPTDALLQPLLAEAGVEGMLLYSWGDGYSGFHGRVARLNGKLVVSGRYSLWGNATKGDMVGVEGMIANLKAMPKDPTSLDGYSLIPVHAWSHSYADVVALAQGLESAGGFDIVLPSELLKRIAQNVPSMRDAV